MRARLCVFLIALGLIAAPHSVEAAWAIDVAWASNFNAGGSGTATFTYAGPVSSGALLVCFIVAANATNGVVTGVEDSSANGSWTQFGQGSPQTGSVLGHAWNAWYYLNSVAATPTVTATFTGGSTNRGMTCGSYTGIATTSAFDVGAGKDETNAGSGTDAVDTGATGATAATNELAIGAALTQVAVTLTSGTGWTSRHNAALGAVFTLDVEDRNVAAPGAVTATWTANNAGADTIAIVGIFKEPASTCTGAFLLTGVGKC